MTESQVSASELQLCPIVAVSKQEAAVLPTTTTSAHSSSTFSPGDSNEIDHAQTTYQQENSSTPMQAEGRSESGCWGATKINIPPSTPRHIAWIIRRSAYAQIAAAPHVHHNDLSPDSSVVVNTTAPIQDPTCLETTAFTDSVSASPNDDSNSMDHAHTPCPQDDNSAPMLAE